MEGPLSVGAGAVGRGAASRGTTRENRYMSARAIVAGLVLGLFVSTVTFFNDAVILQTFLASHHLPVAVFGTAVLLVLGVNPLLRALPSTSPLSSLEIGVILALGLSACAWPSFSFHRAFVANTALPLHWEKVKPAWQAHHVMSYVPGGSAELPDGHIRNTRALVERVVADADGDPASIGGRIWSALGASDQRSWRAASDRGELSADEMAAARSALRAAMQQGPLVGVSDRAEMSLRAEQRAEIAALRARQDVEATQRINWWWLSHSYPDLVSPPPTGAALMLARTTVPSAVAPLITGGAEVPWPAWWPMLSVWAPLALALAAGSLCLALIVHPQWSKRELLPYPIPRFVGELTEPGLLQQRAFWYALAAVAALQSLNYLHAWFPAAPSIPLQLKLKGLAALFPNASRVYGANGVFLPTLYPAVVAFAFFLSSSVSLSVGISQAAYMVLGASLVAAGTSLQADYIAPQTGNMLRFGSYVAMACTILYLGRSYYLDVVRAGLGTSASGTVPGYVTWAARALVASVIAATACVMVAGVDPVFAVAFVVLSLMMLLVLARIVAETGLFCVQSWWMPIGIICAVTGVKTVGPTNYIVLALLSTTLVGDPRTSLLPYLVNGLKLADGTGRADAAGESRRSLGRLTRWLVVMLVVGFVVSTVTALVLQYRYGTTGLRIWNQRTLPALPFDSLASHLGDLQARGELSESVGMSSWERLISWSPDGALLWWAVIGAALAASASIARLRLPWWPLHPVLFLIWGTQPASQLAASFFVGWILKVGVTSFFGAAGYRAVLPVVVGVIAGELAAASAVSIIGATYFLTTGTAPAFYSVLP